MSRQIIGAAFMAALLAASVHAQEAQGRGGQTPAPAEKPSSGQTRTPAPSEAAQPAGQPVNVKLELTITDQLASGAPAKKTVSMIVADRFSGSIRSMANTVRATLNVDATPQILQNGNIRLQLGLEYNPRQPTTAAEKVKGPGGEMLELPRDEGGSSLNQRVVIVLEPNKPLMLSQAADPLSDRRITVEVRVSILK
jgi:glucose/arabinose dehydrogenase